MPVDVVYSGWDSSLVAHEQGRRPAVRLGLSLLRGMNEGAAERIDFARAVRPFATVKDMAQRAQLNRRDLHALADANALSSLAGNRRQALWQSVDAVPDKDILAGAAAEDETPNFSTPTEANDMVADYRSVGLILGRHPVELPRPQLLKARLLPAETLRTFPDGRLARGCGIVTVRQWPGTAKGIMFVTPEDATGNAKVIVWSTLLGKQRKEALSASSPAVYGVWQCHGEVRHLVAHQLVNMSNLSSAPQSTSRDFC
jgi:error-prone DNA polymerase